MTFTQKMALPLLLEEMEELTTELYPFEHTKSDLIACMLSTYEMFIEDYSKAIAEIREQTAEIKNENSDSENIIELANTILEQLDYISYSFQTCSRYNGGSYWETDEYQQP